MITDIWIRAEITHIRGSAPRAVGSTMLIADTDILGTIGGGLLEWRVIHEARAMISHRGDGPQQLTVTLGEKDGQCCGGEVTVALARATSDDVASIQERVDREEPFGTVHIFGAGPVGTAMMRACSLLPLRCHLYDERETVEGRTSRDPAYRVVGNVCEVAANAEPGGAFIVTTHAHMLDFQLVETILRRDDFVFCGLIGSRTKRKKFEQGLSLLDISADRLTCPLGATHINDKRPAIIAATTVAQILETFAHHHGAVRHEHHQAT